jgi:DNA-directed RNA polymerase specialized sigma24 family protein
MNSADLGRTNAFEHFIDLYCPSIFSAIARLTGSADKKKIEDLTIGVFIDLWKNSQELFDDKRPPALVYKILLLHVFTYLKREGYEDRIAVLQNTLPVSPEVYAPILDTDKEELKINLLRRLINLLKR